MRHLARTLAALLLCALPVFAVGLPASAAGDECVRQTSGYGASGVCSVIVLDPEAVCLNGVVQMTYKVSTEPDDAATVVLTWVNPSGPNVVQTGLALAGTVTWPASIPKVALDVQFRSGGTTATARVDPTAASASCASSRVLSVSDAATEATTSTTFSSRVLAATGSEIMPLVAVGSGLLIAGVVLIATRSARLRRVDAGQ